MTLAAGSRNLSAARRMQFGIEPAEFRRLQAFAKERKTSVASLIRSAVRQICLFPAAERGAIVETIAAIELPAIDWKRAKSEIL